MIARWLLRLAAVWRELPAPVKVAQGITPVFFLVGLTCGTNTQLPDAAPQGQGDVAMYRAIANRLRSGEPYYVVAGQELHARGYATVPSFNWRLPTLATFIARLPSERAAATVLFSLGVVSAVAWCLVLARAGHGVLCIIVVPLLLSMAPAWGGDAIHLHEVWAGELVALSLAAGLLGIVPLSVLAGASALAVRELALPYVVIMGAFALWDGRRKEAAAWGLVIAVFVVWLTWHLSVARSLTRPDAFVNGWVTAGGVCYVLKTVRTNLLFTDLPVPLVALAASLTWSGLWAWRAPGAVRVAAVVSGYFCAFAIVGRPDNFYWGLMIAPILPLGLIGWAVALKKGRL